MQKNLNSSRKIINFKLNNDRKKLYFIFIRKFLSELIKKLVSVYVIKTFSLNNEKSSDFELIKRFVFVV